jgi:hypothetical protein
MKAIQESFNRVINARVTFELVLTKAIRKKLEAVGLALQEQQLKELVSRIQNSNETSFAIPDDWVKSTTKATQATCKNENIKVELNEEDVRAVMAQFSSGLKEQYPKFVTQTSRLILDQVRREARQTIKENQKIRKRFEARLRKRWKKPIDLLELFVALALEAGTEFNQEYRDVAAEEKDLVFDVLTRLHARACQIAAEVLTLIKAGFADGAHSRWRTLHELAVVAIFIDKHGPAVAERYLDHEIVEAQKAAVQYERHREAMGHEAYPPNELATIEAAYEDVLSRYGQDFRHPYGWASTAVHKASPTFSDLEEDVELEKWRPYYKMASYNVHAGAKGITFRLGLVRGEQTILLAGSTNTGFTDPAQGTAISLLQISVTLLMMRPNLDVFVRCEMLKTLQEQIGKEFLKTQKSIEHEHLAMQSEGYSE